MSYLKNKETLADTQSHTSADDMYKTYQQILKSRITKQEIHTFTEEETLEALLMYATTWRDVDIRVSVKELFKRFLTVRNILAATPQQLSEVKNLSASEAVLLKVVEAACLKMLGPQTDTKTTHIQSWKDIFDLCCFKLSHAQEEQLLAIYLDSANAIIATEIIQTGARENLPIYPRRIVQQALSAGAENIILAHNHPSGNVSPSLEDIQQTYNIQKMLALVNIKLIDHLVVANNQVYSIRTHKILNNQEDAYAE